jgi:hypothetical protein
MAKAVRSSGMCLHHCDRDKGFPEEIDYLTILSQLDALVSLENLDAKGVMKPSEKVSIRTSSLETEF